ncbi:MAG: NTP transferase domain-containing protein [Leptospiraceae bacterium]|nr:NTP transferase domain-containing protein [Leptospiraceae bacterium]
MICFIPAAGFGTRMKELTSNTPKPLLKVSGKSLLEINLAFGYSLGAREFVINTHYLGNQIEEEVKKYKNCNIHISHETPEILGTAGGIKTAINDLARDEDYILIINPDAIFYPDNDFQIELNNLNSEILLYLKEKSGEDGNTDLNFKQGNIFFEKGNYFYIGLSILKFGTLKEVPLNKYFDLSDIYRSLSKHNQLKGKIFSGEVVDLGDKEKYLQNKEISLPGYTDIEL